MKELNIQGLLSIIVMRRILNYFVHVTRKYNDNMNGLVLQGKIEGARRRKRFPNRWIDQMKSFTGSSLQQNKTNIQDRDRWKEIIHNVT